MLTAETNAPRFTGPDRAPSAWLAVASAAGKRGFGKLFSSPSVVPSNRYAAPASVMVPLSAKLAPTTKLLPAAATDVPNRSVVAGAGLATRVRVLSAGS